MDWEKYGYTIASKYRRKVTLALSQRPKTPKEIAKETDLYLSHVSSTLSALKERGIVECLTPSLRRGKVFGLTEDGREIAREMKRRSEGSLTE